MNKYHEVNEENNQSMDRQIRGEAMMKLEKKFRNIISPRREFLKEAYSNWKGLKCKLYIFNDLLLVVRLPYPETEILECRIALDHSSFAVHKHHYKSFLNLVFLKGARESVHLQFDNAADTANFTRSMTDIIAKLERKEADRLRRFGKKKRNGTKLAVYKWLHEDKNLVTYRPKMQITVRQVIRTKGEPLFVLEFRACEPFRVTERVTSTLKHLIEVEELLYKTYKNVGFNRIDFKSENMGFIETVSKPMKTLEYKSQVVEEFLCYFFSTMAFHSSWR